ncbi:NADH oxidase [Zhongshania aliphaticivorans]|uniref:NADH oxidase n=1 Tax=Zhongshania aliphaticivorans TaxID=1470434 RepID=A0A5S9Q017_9GAMM|nr:NADH:flavin oxidoreductase/NADH oxidase family protein [Zhongshania aliphaticivorans]CAA0110423.1 NADH oxidase [Zhongshania aliphaticivorans]CAA0118133.1 NADH oxidase [Zhongshania aliphaticivorans]CAA0122099.1 NADH oxidase [Zhongshania aliphaticivorans]
MPLLTDPLELPCGVILPNRLLKSAMTEGLANINDQATPRLSALYKRWAEGGTGTLLTGNVMVDRRFLERPGNVVIDGNGGEAALRDWATAGTSANNQLWMQLNHPGRQCQRQVAAQPLAPSDVGIDLIGMFGRPKAMTEIDIRQTITRYAKVAATAKAAGFTGVQIHAAHGYLISQFLSPLANTRSDQWGGSLENRARFLLSTVAEVRAAVGPSFAISVKLNSADFSKGGFSHEDSLQVAQWLSEAGIDLLEVSGGTYEKLALMGDENDKDAAESSQHREAYFLKYAEGIRKVTQIPLAITGGFRSHAAMQQALDSGALDVIGLGRPLCSQANVRPLLAGQQASLPNWECKLQLGSGWLGPKSSNQKIRTLNFGAATQWYYRQIIDLAEGREPNTHTGLIRVMLKHMVAERKSAIKRARHQTQR